MFWLRNKKNNFPAHTLIWGPVISRRHKQAGYLDNMVLVAKITVLRVCQNRGSYISAHVLFNLLNEVRKRDKMRGLASILSLFCNKFNKFNNTGAQMLDSIYHMTLKLL